MSMPARLYVLRDIADGSPWLKKTRRGWRPRVFRRPEPAKAHLIGNEQLYEVRTMPFDTFRSWLPKRMDRHTHDAYWRLFYKTVRQGGKGKVH